MRELRLNKTVLTLALALMPLVATAHEGEHDAAGGHMVIVSVVAGGAADEAGVRDGDRILEVAGETIESMSDLEKVLAAHRGGDRVAFVVERDGEKQDLQFTFGAREDGGPSLGVSLGVMQPHAAANLAAEREDGFGPGECEAWIEDTYQVEALSTSLGIDLSASLDKLNACVADDLANMPSPLPRAWCDNVFKVHCSGLDLLTEIGEAQITFCENVLRESGIDPTGSRAWKTCGENEVFERYSVEGQPSDAAACRAVLEECESDAASRAGD